MMPQGNLDPNDRLPLVADRLRDALTAAAAVQRTRQLSLPEAAPVSHPRRTRSWLVPVGAAISVVAIALGALVTAGHQARTSSGPAGVPAASVAGPPPEYFVIPGNTGGLQVRRTSDGKLTDWFWPPSVARSSQSPVISAAADNRTFFVAAFVNPTTSHFYRFTITDGGKVSGFRPAGVPFIGFPGDFAVSPDGSRIAFTRLMGSGLEDTVNVMDLASGTTRTWHNAVTAETAGREQHVYDMSWLPGGRTLIVDYEWVPLQLDLSNNLAAIALDTTSTGGSLQAHGRMFWSQDDSCTDCVRDLVAGPDGTSVTALKVRHVGSRMVDSVVRMSLATGQPAGVLFSAQGPWLRVQQQYPAIAADGTGRYLAVFTGWQPGGSGAVAPGRTGWISGGKLIPLSVPVPITFLIFGW